MCCAILIIALCILLTAFSFAHIVKRVWLYMYVLGRRSNGNGPDTISDEEEFS